MCWAIPQQICHSFVADLDGDEYTVTPTLFEAVGRSSENQDLDLLLEKYGLGKLAAALTYAIPYVGGGISVRVAAHELDFQYAFAIAVLQALRDVAQEMESADPYFDDIRTTRDQSPLMEN